MSIHFLFSTRFSGPGGKGAAADLKSRLQLHGAQGATSGEETLRPEGLKAYLDAAERRGALAIFYLELVSVIRKSELVALQWADLDVEQWTISVSKQVTKDETGTLVVTRPKTENSVRQISIPQEAVDLLVQEHAKHPGNPWLFPSSRTGAMCHPNSVATLHRRILKDAGLDHLRFHAPRHTFATLALQNGVGIKTVSAMLGTTMQDSPSVPIPTPPGRSRTRRPRPWATSCRRYGKETGKRKTAHRAGTSLPVRCIFCSMWATVWVKIFRSLKIRTFYIAKRPESHCFQGVLWS